MNQKHLKALVGYNLRRLRKENNLSQYHLAKAMGLSQGSLSKVESGKLAMGLIEAFKVSNLFDCDIEALFTPRG
jgi:transcriptional regulator with XRE-family HTH domain